MTATVSQDITPELIAEHGLKEDEAARMVDILGRTPTPTELGIFSVMWSEHCSYKSSRVWLKTLPTESPQVIQGPGENAGVVDIGDGDAVVFKMESHNHPSYIEPYQGAATGVGGIMRDVFTMGARPVANLNALRFGAPEHQKTRHLVSGVVAGIGGYGNCTGVPTVGGEVNFDARYNNNILVNAMCVGVARADKIFYSAARGAGHSVVYVGSKTGRDGIHGATMASAEFDDDSAEKRPTVQVGDPFTEKLLIEACLELMAGDAIIAIQDMGAAGLTSSSVEMADKGGVGIRLDLDQVPQREAGMNAYEMMLSESQERMLMVLRPGAEAQAEAIFRKWELEFAVIGETTESGRIEIWHKGERAADIPVRALSAGAPEYQRPWTARPAPVVTQPADVPAPDSLLGALKAMMAGPHLSSRRWVWEQYDHMVMADTVQRPGGDAAVIRVGGPGSRKALALACDVTPRYCAADPETGGAQAVAETWRNLTAVGAQPLGITNCLNFGNPERPEIMGEIAGAVAGMGRAARALSFPVVSGNVSLYNETNGVAIPPTPAIGGVGLLPDLNRMATIALKPDDAVLMLLGETYGALGQSLYQAHATGAYDGAPPPVDLDAEQRVGDLVRGLIRETVTRTVHDVSDGGILVAAAEMALAGGRGVRLDAGEINIPAHALWFGEDQARYLIAASDTAAQTVRGAAAEVGVPVRIIGRIGGDALALHSETPVPLAELSALHEAWFPSYFGKD